MNKKIALILIVCLLAASCIATGIISYNLYISAKEVEQTCMLSIQALQQDIRRIEVGIAAIKAGTKHSYDLTSEPLEKNAGKNGSDGLTELNHDELMRLKKIIQSTGLEKLASMENIDPAVLQDLYDKHTERENIRSYHQSLLERNSEQHTMDKERYDEELNRLYNLARFRRGTVSGSGERETAFDELLSKYPDAYATAMVVAERAIMAGFRRDFEKVENYYDILIKTGNQDVPSVVTDRGTEALPNIEHTLARHYISTGRTREADQMIESLESNYNDSMVVVRKRGSGPFLQPISKVIEELKKLNDTTP